MCFENAELYLALFAPFPVLKNFPVYVGSEGIWSTLVMFNENI